MLCQARGWSLRDVQDLPVYRVLLEERFVSDEHRYAQAEAEARP